MNNPLRVDCTTEGCRECAAQIVDGTLRFRVRHHGKPHIVEITAEMLLALLQATAQNSSASIKASRDRLASFAG